MPVSNIPPFLNTPMSSRRSILFSGAIAAVVAIAFIAISVIAGFPGNYNLAQNSIQTSEGGTGTLAVLLTDPPTVPSGTTALYANYSDVQVHVSGDGNNSGWIDLQSAGSINLMGVINATQTIASAKIFQGDFNAMRFNITSAEITFNGLNYSVGLIFGRHTVYVPIIGGIRVVEGETMVSVIDMTPTVFLINDPSNPSFVLIPSARGYVLPSASVGSVHTAVGDRDDINTNPALMWLHQNSRFLITGVSLTTNSLSLYVTNTGNTSLVFRLATISSTQTPSGGRMGSVNGLPLTSISEYFVVSANSSLVPITGKFTTSQLYDTVAANGYLLLPHASVTFSYSGSIIIGGLSVNVIHQTQAINVGQQYIVKISTGGLIAMTDVTATA